MADSILIGVGAGLAVALELIEAAAIVLGVGLSRGWRDAVLGAVGAVLTCAVVGLLAGPVLLQQLPDGPLEIVIGVLLLLFGLEWLRKGTLRIAGRRARSSALREHLEARGGRGPAAPAARQAGLGRAGGQLQGRVAGGCRGDPDRDRARPGRGCAHTGARGLRVRGGRWSLASAAWLRGPLQRLPETELKYGVGVLLSTFGVVFLGEGAGAHWPGDDLALLYVALTLAACTQLQAHLLAAGSRSQVRA